MLKRYFVTWPTNRVTMDGKNSDLDLKQYLKGPRLPIYPHWKWFFSEILKWSIRLFVCKLLANPLNKPWIHHVRFQLTHAYPHFPNVPQKVHLEKSMAKKWSPSYDFNLFYFHSTSLIRYSFHWNLESSPFLDSFWN